MKHISILLLVLFAMSCIGCSTFHPTINKQNERPGDFCVEYEWREKSLPPPYHYEYTIILKPSGQSEIVLIPDYPSSDVPKLTENFKVAEQDLHELYRIMVENGLFTRKWRQMGGGLVGSRYQKLIVTAQGKKIQVEDSLVYEQQAPAKVIYSAVQALVPQKIWEQLQAQRQLYMQRHPHR